jgi:membrane-associated phospholipid phosphatase
MLNSVLHFIYSLSAYEALALVIIWGRSDRTRLTEQLCLALGIGGVATVIIWTLAPSFGAFTTYSLPTTPDMKRAFALNSDYANLLLNLWAHGPGHISPLTVKGLVGFPSFHTAQALIVTWYARRTKFWFYPFLTFNAVVIVSTPIQGGHHVVDIFGGGAVAALAIWLTARIAKRVSVMQNKKEIEPALAAAG